MLQLKEFLNLGWDVAHQIQLEPLLAEELSARRLVRILVIVDVVHVDKRAFARLKGVSGPFNQRAKIILTFRDSSDFDDLNRNGQVGRPQNLIDRVVNVVDEARHEDSEHIVVLNAASVRSCSEIQLSHVTDKFDNGSVVDWAGNLNGAEGPLIAIEQLLCALDERVREVARHRANINSLPIAFLCARTHPVR